VHTNTGRDRNTQEGLVREANVYEEHVPVVVRRNKLDSFSFNSGIPLFFLGHGQTFLAATLGDRAPNSQLASQNILFWWVASQKPPKNGPFIDLVPVKRKIILFAFDGFSPRVDLSTYSKAGMLSCFKDKTTRFEGRTKLLSARKH
jgi:hypothetical protein